MNHNIFTHFSEYFADAVAAFGDVDDPEERGGIELRLRCFDIQGFDIGPRQYPLPGLATDGCTSLLFLAIQQILIANISNLVVLIIRWQLKCSIVCLINTRNTAVVLQACLNTLLRHTNVISLLVTESV